MVRLLGCVAVLLAARLALPGGASAQAADDPVYRATIDEAVAEFSAGHWEEARALFKRAHERQPNARTLRGMGQAAFEMRLYVTAIRELEAALRDTRKPLEGEMRAGVEQLVLKARAFVGRIRPVVEPPQAKLLVDGRDPDLEADGTLLLDVGSHVISATLDGYKPTNLRLSIEGGSDQVVRVPLEPLLAVEESVPAIGTTPAPAPQATPSAPSPGPTPTPASTPAPAPAPPPDQSESQLDTFAWIALVGAAGFGATAGVLYFAVGDSQYDELEQTCGDAGCSDRQISDSGVETTDTLTNVFLGLAVASGVTAGVLFAIDAASGPAEEEPLSLQLGPGAVRLRGTF